MLRTRLLILLPTLLLVFSGAVLAAPKKIMAQYEVTRKGQPFANVTETFTQENGKYCIESVTKGIGVYALLGVRKLTSEGDVTAEGLKPSHFELHQGDNLKKSLFADFDWVNNTLNMKAKSKESSVPLQAGAQDLVSYAYQWMFTPPVGDEISLPVTTGKKLRAYRYQVVAKDLPIETAAGTFKTLHLADASKADAKSDEQKQLWLAVDQHYLVVRIMLQDESGNTVEQRLTHLDVE